ncbi:hypothetical protein ACM66B_004424 [Microbotryomycetes sp. NB124-2]
MAPREGHGSSYITSEDLAAIDLTQDGDGSAAAGAKTSSCRGPASFSIPPRRTTTHSSAPLSPNTESCRGKRVLFCPLALVMECAQDGQRDPALVHGKRLDSRGRPRLQVKTYSVDTPNLSGATSRAWKNVCAGFSNSIQPLLSPQSTRRDYSPERELERSSFARSRAYSDPKDDPSFTPSSNKLSIKLPALSRKCCAPAVASGPSKGCLKSPVLGSSPPNSLPSPSLSTDAGTSASTTSYLDTPTSVSSPRQTSFFPELSPVESAQNSLRLATSPIRSSTGVTFPSTKSLTDSKIPEVVPIIPCCPNCHEGTELGLSPDHVERWSKAAKRKHRRDSVGAEAGVGTATTPPSSTLACVTLSSTNKDDEADPEAEAEAETDRGSAFGSVVVDELGKEQGKTARQELNRDCEGGDDQAEAASSDDEAGDTVVKDVESSTNERAPSAHRSPPAFSTKSGVSPPAASSSVATSRPPSADDTVSESGQRSSSENATEHVEAAGRKRKFSLSKTKLQGWVESGIKSSIAGAAAAGQAAGSTRAFG